MKRLTVVTAIAAVHFAASLATVRAAFWLTLLRPDRDPRSTAGALTAIVANVLTLPAALLRTSSMPEWLDLPLFALNSLLWAVLVVWFVLWARRVCVRFHLNGAAVSAENHRSADMDHCSAPKKADAACMEPNAAPRR